jgi:hypothetical protein
MNASVIDIRTYAVSPGFGGELVRLLREGSLPLLEHFGIHTVAFGPSTRHSDRYPVIRSFRSESERVAQLEAFYGSAAWAKREPLVTQPIDNFHQIVLALPDTLTVRK